MKYFFIILFIAYHPAGNSQTLFSTATIGEEDKFSLVKLERNEQLVLSTFSFENKDTTKGKMTFYLSHDTINFKSFVGETIYVDSKDCNSYSHFPDFISISNNHFKIASCKQDSLLFDSKKGIWAVYRFYSNAFSKKSIRFILNYLNDTTILESMVQVENPEINNILYFLDKKHRLKSIKFGLNSKDLTGNYPDTNHIEFVKVIRFNYSQTKKEIENIQVFEINGSVAQLSRTQYFAFKNNRPNRSYSVSNTSGEIEYEQKYSYKLMTKN